MACFRLFFGRSDVHTLEPPSKKCEKALCYKGLSNVSERANFEQNVIPMVKIAQKRTISVKVKSAKK